MFSHFYNAYTSSPDIYAKRYEIRLHVARRLSYGFLRKLY